MKPNSIIYPDKQIIIHFRVPDKDGTPYARGGATAIYDGHYNAIVVALCSPDDNYNKKVGINIAKSKLTVSNKHRQPLCDNVRGKITFSELKNMAADFIETVSKGTSLEKFVKSKQKEVGD